MIQRRILKLLQSLDTCGITWNVKLENVKFLEKEALKNAKERNKLSLRTTTNSVDSMPKRAAAIIKSEGYPAKY